MLRRRKNIEQRGGRGAAVLLSAALSLGGTAGVAAGVADAVGCTLPEGQGTWYFGYQISTEADLAQIGTVCPIGEGSIYMLMNDITLTPPPSGSSNHVPIGSAASPFQGYLHGQGHSIDGLVIDAGTDDDIGFFAAMSNYAEVAEISFTNASVSGGDRVGIVAGSATLAYPLLVTVEGTVTGDDEVGGLFGLMYQGNLNVITADVVVNGLGTTGKVGGLVGNSAWDRVSGPTFNNLDVTSDVTSAGSDVGGVVGWAVQDFDFEGTLDVVTSVNGLGDNVGGVVGSSRGTLVTEGVEFNSSEATMTVVGDVTSAGSNVGGVVGTAGAVLSYPRFEVSVDVTMTGSGTTGGGGFAGTARNGALFGGVEYDGTVLAASSSSVGGLFGLQRGAIDIGPSSVTGSVTGSSDVGGVAGAIGPAITLTNIDAAVAVLGATNVGGIVGTLDGTPFDMGGYVGVVSGARIAASKSTGSVTGTSNVGGIVGRTLDQDVVIENSYFDGLVTGPTSVGGLVGLADTADGSGDTTVTNSYVIGSQLPVTADPLIGAVHPDTTLTTDGLFFDTDRTGSSASVHGTAGDSSTLTVRDTFVGAEWSIVDGWAATGYVWGICAPRNDGYPFLVWELTSAAGCLAAPTWVDDEIGPLTVGAVFDDGVEATGSEPITYAVTAGALPDGLSLDTATGAITGTPTTAGPYDVTITASNEAGSIEVRLTGTVDPASPPPDPEPEQDPEIDITLNFSVGANVAGGGQTTTVRGSGLKANSAFRVVLRSDPVEIGSGVADGNGEFEAVLTIPADTPYGAHSATVYGTAPDGSDVEDVSYFTLDENGVVLEVSESAPTAPYSPSGSVPTTTGVVPSPVLPATGSDLGFAVIAGMLVVAGAMLMLGLRRPTGRRSAR